MPTQCGVYHETYQSDLQHRPTTAQRVRLGLMLILIIVLPFIASSTQIRVVNQVLIASIGAIGLNVLTGFTGQISLGQGAFLGIGAYACGLLMVYYHIPWLVAMFLAAFVTALAGGVFGLPSLRLKGLYLAVATLAAQQIVEWVINNWDPIDGVRDGEAAAALNIPSSHLFGQTAWRLNNNEYAFYVLATAILIVAVIATTNLFRTHIGRAFIAIRDQDIAAEVMGVNLFFFKVLAFSISSFLVGLAGALIALHSTAISLDRFKIDTSIEYLAMIIIGGLGTVSGSIYGAIFIILLPEVLRAVGQQMIESGLIGQDTFIYLLPFIQQGAFGAAIVLTLIIESEGIQKMWRDVKDYFRLWPFSY